VLADLMLRPVPRNFGAEFAVNAFLAAVLESERDPAHVQCRAHAWPGLQAMYDGGTPYSTFVF